MLDGSAHFFSPEGVIDIVEDRFILPFFQIIQHEIAVLIGGACARQAAVNELAAHCCQIGKMPGPLRENDGALFEIIEINLHRFGRFISFGFFFILGFFF